MDARLRSAADILMDTDAQTLQEMFALRPDLARRMDRVIHRGLRLADTEGEAVGREEAMTIVLGPVPCQGCRQSVTWDGRAWIDANGVTKHVCGPDPALQAARQDLRKVTTPGRRNYPA